MIAYNEKYYIKHYGVLAHCLKNNPDLLQIEDNEGRTPLHYLFDNKFKLYDVFSGESYNIFFSKQQLEDFIKVGIDKKDHNGLTPLHLAAKAMDCTSLTQIIDLCKIENYNVLTNDGQNILHIALENANYRLVFDYVARSNPLGFGKSNYLLIWDIKYLSPDLITQKDINNKSVFDYAIEKYNIAARSLNNSYHLEKILHDKELVTKLLSEDACKDPEIQYLFSSYLKSTNLDSRDRGIILFLKNSNVRDSKVISILIKELQDNYSKRVQEIESKFANHDIDWSFYFDFKKIKDLVRQNPAGVEEMFNLITLLDLGKNYYLHLEEKLLYNQKKYFPDLFNSYLIKDVKKEIERINWHPAGQFSPQYFFKDKIQYNNGNDIVKKTPSGIAKAYHALTPPGDSTEIKKNIKTTFKNALHQSSIFRSKQTKTFSRGFSSPDIEYAAKRTLTAIIKQFTDKNASWGNFAYGSGLSCQVPGEKNPRKCRLPRNAAKIVKLYEQARNYDGITWDEALQQVEIILAKNYTDKAKRPKNRTEETQVNYNMAFDFINSSFHNLFVLEQENLFTTLTQLIAETKTIWIDAQDDAKNFLDKMKNFSHDKSIDTSRVLFYMCQKFFEMSKTIDFGRRNGSELYNNLMKCIAITLNLKIVDNGNELPPHIIRKFIENYMRDQKNFFIANARSLEDECPELCAQINRKAHL